MQRWTKILPFFLVAWFARRNCSRNTFCGTTVVEPYPGVWIRVRPPNVRDHRAGPGDQVKAESAPVAGSGASTCWAVSPDTTTKEDKP
jgi:hypothetical protein